MWRSEEEIGLDEKESKRRDGCRAPISESSKPECAFDSFDGLEEFAKEEERFDSVEAT